MYFNYQNRIFVIGSPRSGTTWLAKILDSHEQVIYRHEPDSLVFSDIPYFPDEDSLPQLIDPFRSYLNELTDVRYPKSACSLPHFNKTYRSNFSGKLRKLAESVSRILEVIAGKLHFKLKGLKVPDLISGDLPKPAAIVIKSVDSIGRMRLLNLTDPETRIVHLIRHPCAFVESQLRGQQLHKMTIETFPTTQLRLAGRLGKSLNIEIFNRYSIEQKLASLWMLQNEDLFNGLRHQPQYSLMIYEKLCSDPLSYARRLFQTAGLTWSKQSEDFINQSLDFKGNDVKYFQVIRNPRDSIDKWQKRMSAQQIEDIYSVVEDSSIFQYCYG